MRTFVPLFCAALFFCAAPAFAKDVVITGTHTKDEIKKTCERLGGDFSSNLDGYVCSKPCPGGTCAVMCDPHGGCKGSVPKTSVTGSMKTPATPKSVLQ